MTIYSLDVLLPNWEPIDVSCLILTVASWPANRFFKRQVRWSGISISLRIFQFVVIHTVKGFSTINEAGVFSGIPLLSPWSHNVDNLISGSSAFFKSSLYIWQFLVHVPLKPSLKDFEHYLAGMWNECNCAIVWSFFGIALLWEWNENWHFPFLWPLLSFPNLMECWVQHFHSIIF